MRACVCVCTYQETNLAAACGGVKWPAGEPKVCLLLCVDDSFDDCSEYEALVHDINASHERHLSSVDEPGPPRTGCAYLVRFSIYESSSLARRLDVSEEDVPLIKLFR